MIQQSNTKSVISVFSKNLKKFREKAGLSQEQLAEIAESSKNHISQLETGVRFPSSTMLERLAKALNVNYYELFIDYENIMNEETKTKIIRELTEKLGDYLENILEI